jgi:hypothetical protein
MNRVRSLVDSDRVEAIRVLSQFPILVPAVTVLVGIVLYIAVSATSLVSLRSGFPVLEKPTARLGGKQNGQTSVTGSMAT